MNFSGLCCMMCGWCLLMVDVVNETPRFLLQESLDTTKPVSQHLDNESDKVVEDLTAQQASRQSAKATAFHHSRNLGRSVVIANFLEQSNIRFTEDSVPGLAVHDQINTGGEPCFYDVSVLRFPQQPHRH